MFYTICDKHFVKRNGLPFMTPEILSKVTYLYVHVCAFFTNRFCKHEIKLQTNNQLYFFTTNMFSWPINVLYMIDWLHKSINHTPSCIHTWQDIGLKHIGAMQGLESKNQKFNFVSGAVGIVKIKDTIKI